MPLVPKGPVPPPSSTIMEMKGPREVAKSGQAIVDQVRIDELAIPINQLLVKRVTDAKQHRSFLLAAGNGAG